MSNDVFDLFDISNIDNLSSMPEKQTFKNDFYDPKPEEGKDGIYSALIRFLPINPEKGYQYIKKYTIWIPAEYTGTGKLMKVDLSNDGSDIVNDTYWKLKNSDSAINQENAKKISRTVECYANVLILKDPQHPEYDGTIRVFKFKTKIENKIKEEQHPTDGFTDPCNVFNPLAGKDFVLSVSTVGGFRNYDMSKFKPTTTPISFKDENGQMLTITRTPEGAQALQTLYGMEHDLDDQKPLYPWNEETDRIVRNYCSSLLTGNASIARETVLNTKSSTSAPVMSNPFEDTAVPSTTEATGDKTESADGGLGDYLDDIFGN